MHMADALLSPAVGGTAWAVSAGAVAWSSARLRRLDDDRQAPLMGVLGAFLFAAQMINFAIPGTGSSGHLAGGVLLAILLGPHGGFLTVASVLVVQALFFADGGLLALGCNIFNLGFLPAFVVYPLFYRRLIGADPGPLRAGAVTMAAAVIAMQLGSLAIVIETFASGISSLPVDRFLLLMQPIHLAIGLVEGAATFAVLSFVRKARPELLRAAVGAPSVGSRSRTRFCLAFLAAGVFLAGGATFLASASPDGLEWSIRSITGESELRQAGEGIHGMVAGLQGKSALFPDYSLPAPGAAAPSISGGAGTAVAGLFGTLLTLMLIALAGVLLRKGSRGKIAP